MPLDELITIRDVRWISPRSVSCCLLGAATILALHSASAAELSQFATELRLSRGTLAVAVLESNQIVVAIDSRLTVTGRGRTNQIRDGFEKIVTLSPDVGFFVTGVNRFEGKHWTNALNEIAKTRAQLFLRNGEKIKLKEIADEFKTEVAAELARCTVGDIYNLLLGSMKYGASNVFSAVFVGKDADAVFRMYRVACTATVNTNTFPPQGRLDYNIVEHKFSGRRTFEFFGVGQAFDRAKTEPKSRVASAIRQIRSSQTLLAEPIAAALLDVGVSELGDGPDSPVGYPLFVYVADADGFRLTRKVSKGAGVPFDYRNQSKQ